VVEGKDRIETEAPPWAGREQKMGQRLAVREDEATVVKIDLDRDFCRLGARISIDLRLWQ
jgi:hypothetical protein